MRLENYVKGVVIEVTTEELEDLNRMTFAYAYDNTTVKVVAKKLLDTLDKFLSNTISKK